MIFRFFKNRRRKKILAQPFPSGWLRHVEDRVPYYNILPPEIQNELQNSIQIFIHEKKFVGCDGLEINDEIRVTIAAQACILLLGRQTDFFPQLHTILVYPHPYVAPTQQELPGGVVIESSEVRFGESWYHGQVVLAWDQVVKGACDIHDGQNVILHEFAHQLDEESGSANGAPVLSQSSHYTSWARVLSEEFEALIDDAETGRKTVMDTYGSINPAEFFAVATETFFEKPKQLKTKHPELYDQLKTFYKQDPVLWMSGETGRRNTKR